MRFDDLKEKLIKLKNTLSGDGIVKNESDAEFMKRCVEEGGAIENAIASWLVDHFIVSPKAAMRYVKGSCHWREFMQACMGIHGSQRIAHWAGVIAEMEELVGINE